MNNREMSRGGTLLPRHRALAFAAVSNGQTKEQCGWTMGGIYRPLRPNCPVEDIKAVTNDQKALSDVLWPGITCVNVMKHRDHGERVGERAILGWERGRIIDTPDNVKIELQAQQHGIPLGSGF